MSIPAAIHPWRYWAARSAAPSGIGIGRRKLAEDGEAHALASLVPHHGLLGEKRAHRGRDVIAPDDEPFALRESD